MSETIVANVYMMDMLALRLDQSNPGSQHLAAEFNVPEKVKMKCQYSRENSPTKHMLEIKQSAEDTHFSVQDLIDGLRAISRNDLVKKVEDCLPGKFCCELQLAYVHVLVTQVSLAWKTTDFTLTPDNLSLLMLIVKVPSVHTFVDLQLRLAIITEILLYSRASNELITPHASSRVCNQLEFTTNVC